MTGTTVSSFPPVYQKCVPAIYDTSLKYKIDDVGRTYIHGFFGLETISRCEGTPLLWHWKRPKFSSIFYVSSMVSSPFCLERHHIVKCRTVLRKAGLGHLRTGWPLLAEFAWGEVGSFMKNFAGLLFHVKRATFLQGTSRSFAGKTGMQYIETTPFCW